MTNFEKRMAAEQKKADKVIDKKAKVVQTWINKGYTMREVQDLVWNRIGYITKIEDDKIHLMGKKNTIIRTVSSDSIINPA